MTISATTATLLSAALGAQTSVTRQEREPAPRVFASAAYDVARGCVVMFGGQLAAADSGTHEWNGQRWNVTAASPPPSVGHATVYDVARGRTLAFGGDLRLLYEGDGSSWQSRLVGAGPAPTRYPAMAYDVARRVTVLYDYAARQTWEFDGAVWTQRPAATLPQVVFAKMAYDAAGQRSLLVGINGGQLEVWGWRGSDWQRLSQTTFNDGPEAERYHEIAFDAFRQRLVLFGGSAGSFLNETWEWDGSVWTRRRPATRPLPRYGHALAYDVARRRTVLFGGQSNSPLADTWEWDGTDWTPRTPPPRVDQAMVYDAARGRTMLFGGRSMDGEVLGDTWEWDGFRWNRLTPAHEPLGRHRHALAFDARRQRVVLHGGAPARGAAFSDTWEWDGRDWTLVLPVASPPASPGMSAMTWDVVRQRVILVPGLTIPQTWEWDGVNWVRVPVSQGPYGGLLSYDVRRQRAVLVGNGTWEWDGSAWSQRSAVPAPYALRAMAYDPTRQRVVAAGAELWEWDGAAWSLVAPGFQANALAFDAQRGRLLAMTERGAAVTGVTGSSSSFGQGCSSRSVGAPLLASYLPFAGNESFAMHLGNVAPAQACVIGLASGSRVSQIASCTLYLDQPLFLPVLASPFGVARLALPIPDVAGLRGVRLYAQGFTAESSAPLGIGASAGRLLTIGD